jgi:hypothetical protein
MRVRIEQTGRNGATLEIDAPSVRAGGSFDVGGGSNGGDAVSSDSDRLSDAIVRVDGEDATVDENDVGARLLSPCPRTDCRRNRREQ